MTIYAEELRIMMDAIMDIIFDHGTHRQARTFMAVFTLDAEHPYPDGVLPHWSGSSPLTTPVSF